MTDIRTTTTPAAASLSPITPTPVAAQKSPRFTWSANEVNQKHPKRLPHGWVATVAVQTAWTNETTEEAVQAESPKTRTNNAVLSSLVRGFAPLHEIDLANWRRQWAWQAQFANQT